MNSGFNSSPLDFLAYQKADPSASLLLTYERVLAFETGTVGVLYMEGKGDLPIAPQRPVSFIVEDEFRPLSKKIMGHARIPAGSYDVGVRTVGGFHNRMLQAYPHIHKGMLQIGTKGPDNGIDRKGDVPGFTYALIHTGNTPADTEGCMIMGGSFDLSQGKPFVGNSKDIYTAVYPSMVAAALQGKLRINIIDRDRGAIPIRYNVVPTADMF